MAPHLGTMFHEGQPQPLYQFTDDSDDITTAATTPNDNKEPNPEFGSRIGSQATKQTISCCVKNICCVGAGYVGGPTAAVIAYHNPHLIVTVVDKDVSRIRQWNSGHLPIYEPDLDQILAITRDGISSPPFPELIDSNLVDMPRGEDSEREHGPNLFFSSDVGRSISQADMIFVSVNTPTKTTGHGAGKATDMTALDDVVKEIAQHAKLSTIVVEKSTVPCGTADYIQAALKKCNQNKTFEILSNPEFLSAGTAIQDLLSPSRVLIGSQPTKSGQIAADALSKVYCWVDPSRIIHTNTYSSELAKLVSNVFLAQRISSINSISAICEKVGADVCDIRAAVGADPRIGFHYLQAGVGFGGSCLEKDIRSLIYLAEGLGLTEVAEYWEQVLIINEWQGRRLAQRVVESLNGTLKDKKITVLGYAFKNGTDDTRGTPALRVIRILLEYKPNELAIYDPLCDRERVEREVAQTGRKALSEQNGSVKVYGDVYDACQGSYAIIVLNDYCESDIGMEVVEREGCFDPLNWSKIASRMAKPKLVFDGRGVLEVEEMKKLGLRVESIGRVINVDD
ncbi:UDP-glucose 6-dehydrogenase [Bisporella sp. PMI_857]|nr:UDP-glucose 6-dehydrogenase [Bisporella sp. PMI_857]